MDNEYLHVAPTTLDELRRLATTGMLYAMIDACDAGAVPFKMRELGPERAACMYSGKAEEAYWDFAPYLATADAGLLDWIVATLWKGPWGFFAVTETNLATVRTHFKRFTFATMPDGQQVYFRYYDPRILPVFLENADRAELSQFFGPVRTFIVAGKWPAQDVMQRYSHLPGGRT